MIDPLRDPEFVELGRDTNGIVHRDTCLAAGLTDRRIDRLVTHGRWQRVHPRVFATFSGPVTLAARQRAGVLYVGRHSSLSHRTSAARWGFGRDDGQVWLIAPYGRQIDPQPGLTICRSRTLTDDDIAATDPPRTRPERTVLDLLPFCRSEDAALALVGEAVRSGRTNAVRIAAAIDARPRVRWRRVLKDALPSVAAGAQSPLEVREAALRRRHGLPEAVRQHRRSVDGAVQYLDVRDERWRIHVELDGRLGHDSVVGQWRDMRRDNVSEIAGLRHLRYGWADIAGRPCDVAAQLAAVYRQQGWPGPYRRCPICPGLVTTPSVL